VSRHHALTRAWVKFLRAGLPHDICDVVFERGSIDDPSGPGFATRLTAALALRGGGRLTAVQPVEPSDERTS